eukprot:4815186-Pleurochrysis_carterae.AAC.2
MRHPPKPPPLIFAAAPQDEARVKLVEQRSQRERLKRVGAAILGGCRRASCARATGARMRAHAHAHAHTRAHTRTHAHTRARARARARARTRTHTHTHTHAHSHAHMPARTHAFAATGTAAHEALYFVRALTHTHTRV